MYLENVSTGECFTLHNKFFLTTGGRWGNVHKITIFVIAQPHLISFIYPFS